VAALLALSTSATFALIYEVTAFDQAPGTAGIALEHWPAGSALRRHRDKAELLVFTHPLCSCTNATIAELARFKAQLKGTQTPEITFVVYRPERNGNWEGKSLISKMADLPDAHLVWDDHGREAERFGAATSGDIFLYNASGDLVFHGGITGSRGHEGDNYGLDGLLAAMESGKRRTSPVFGCGLRSWDGPVAFDAGRMQSAPRGTGRFM
jgi:hypothetical protein